MTKIRFKRGLASSLGFTPEDGEPVWTNGSGNEDKRLLIGDGVLSNGITVGWHSSPTPGMKSLFYYYPFTATTAFVTGASLANIVS